MQERIDFDAVDPYEIKDPVRGTVMLLADLLNSKGTAQLRKVLADYNDKAREAASGQLDMFTGEPDDRETILKRLNDLYNNATRKEQQRRQAEIMEQRRQAAGQEPAKTGDAPAGSGGERTSGGELADTRIKERRAKIETNLGSKYALSDEPANNGELFYKNETGETNLATIPEDIFDKLGVDPVPFKLTETMGWHVFEHHAKECSFKTIDDAIDFVLSVINNVDHVRLGRDNSYIFSVENNRPKVGRWAVTIMINSQTGEFMGIRTSGYEKIVTLKERPLLWERGTIAVPEDVATPTITTIKPEQGDQATRRTKGQSDGEKMISERNAGTQHPAASGEPQDFPSAQLNPESADVSALSHADNEDKVTKSPQEKQIQEQESSESEEQNGFTPDELSEAKEIADNFTGQDLRGEIQRKMHLGYAKAGRLAKALKNMPKVKPDTEAPVHVEPTPDNPEKGDGFTIKPGTEATVEIPGKEQDVARQPVGEKEEIHGKEAEPPVGEGGKENPGHSGETRNKPNDFQIGEKPEGPASEVARKARQAVLGMLAKAGIKVNVVSRLEARQKASEAREGREAFRDSRGEVYGWTDGKEIYLSEGALDADTPIHEYTHLWAKMKQQGDPKFWNEAKEALKETHEWERVVNDPEYEGLLDGEDSVASEVLSRLTGREGQERMERWIRGGARPTPSALPGAPRWCRGQGGCF